MRAKTVTTIRFRDRLNSASSTIESGITRRGNWILRTSGSLSTTPRTAFMVASPKNVKRTMEASSWAP